MNPSPPAARVPPCAVATSCSAARCAVTAATSRSGAPTALRTGAGAATGPLPAPDEHPTTTTSTSTRAQRHDTRPGSPAPTMPSQSEGDSQYTPPWCSTACVFSAESSASTMRATYRRLRGNAASDV